MGKQKEAGEGLEPEAPGYGGVVAVGLSVAACVATIALCFLVFVDVPPDDGTDAAAAANRGLIIPVVWLAAVALGAKGLSWAWISRRVDRRLAGIGAALALPAVVIPVALLIRVVVAG